MARFGEPICRLCRVERTKLFLKGNKCLTEKCSLERRAYAPGQHGRGRKRILGYGIQLREKQKLKRYYGMSENQFRLFFERAERQKGITGENLLTMLERRFDNAVFLLGFARSRAHARQLVNHGHFTVNGHIVNVPSFLVSLGDEIVFKPRTAAAASARELADLNRNKTMPGWLAVDWDNMKGNVLGLPTRADVTMSVEEHLVIELYSK